MKLKAVKNLGAALTAGFALLTRTISKFRKI